MDQIDLQIAARARALADEHARETFKLPGAAAPRAGGADGFEGATFSPLVSRLQSCLRCIELREGLLIEHAIRLALSASPRLLLIGKRVFAVTDTDRAVADRNPHVSLDQISVPEPGQPVGHAEIDCVFVDRGTGTIFFVDIKRSGSRDNGALRIRAAAVAALRALQREGVRYVRSRLLHVRWFAKAEQPLIVTRETVDSVLPVSVRAIVDVALRHYRSTCEREVRALVTAVAAGDEARDITSFSQSMPRGDEEAILRAFGRGSPRAG